MSRFLEASQRETETEGATTALFFIELDLSAILPGMPFLPEDMGDFLNKVDSPEFDQITRYTLEHLKRDFMVFDDWKYASDGPVVFKVWIGGGPSHSICEGWEPELNRAGLWHVLLNPEKFGGYAEGLIAPLVIGLSILREDKSNRLSLMIDTLLHVCRANRRAMVKTVLENK